MGRRSKTGKKTRVSKSKSKSRGAIKRPKAKARPRRRAGRRFELDVALESILANLPSVRRALTAFFLFALPLIIYLGNTEYGYTKSIFALFFISFLLVLWALEAVLKRDYRINLTPLFLPGALLLAIAALSMINATSLGVSLQSLGLLFYFFLFYLFIANIVEREWEIHLFLGSILAAAFLAAVYGILQYFGVLPGTPGVPGGTSAIISSLGNRNYLGGFLVYLVFPTLILPLRLRSRILRGLSLFALATSIYTLTLIKSDGAWLALTLSGLFFIIGLFCFKIFHAFKLKRGWVVVGGFLIALTTLAPFSGQTGLPDMAKGGWPSFQIGLPMTAMGEQGDGLYLEKPLSASSSSGGPLERILKRFQGRTRAWDWWVGWEMLKDHPLLGVGLGHYKVQFLPYKAKFLATERGKHYDFYILRAAQAHNEYVQAAAEMGGLGILAGGFVLFVIFRSSLQKLGRAKSESDKFIILALSAGVVAVLTHALVSFPLHLPASALDFILLLGLLNSRYFHQEGDESPQRPNSRKFLDAPLIVLHGRTTWAALALVLALGISVSTLAYRDWLADTYLDRGERDLKLGRIDLAKFELERSLALDFQPRKALYWLGSIYHRLGKERNDQKLLDRGLELLERSLASFQVEPTYLQLAQLYLNRGEFDRAMDYVNELLAMSPEPTRELDARYLAAVIERERGDLDKALERLNELTFQHKDYERAYVTRAKIYLEQGNAGLARLDLEEALKIVKRELDRNRDRLVRLKEQGRLTLDRYAQLKNEITQLESEREAIEKLLQELSE